MRNLHAHTSQFGFYYQVYHLHVPSLLIKELLYVYFISDSLTYKELCVPCSSRGSSELPLAFYISKERNILSLSQ